VIFASEHTIVDEKSLIFFDESNKYEGSIRID